MRRYDKLKNINKANLLIEQLYVATRTSGVIYEDFNLMTEDGIEQVPNISNIKTGIEQAGGSLGDKDTQLALLDKFIDANFDMSKVNAQSVIQDSGVEKSSLTESHDAGGLGHLIHQAHSTFDDAENSVKLLALIHKYVSRKITVNSIKHGLHALEKILNFVPDLFSKAIYKIMRSFGSSLENAHIGSIGGPILWIALMAGIAIVTFPSVVSGVASGATVAGVITLLYKLWNIVSTLWTGFKRIVSANVESSDKVVSVVDLMDELEKSKGIGFEHKEIIKLEEWYNHLDKKSKGSVTKIITQMVEYIKNGKSFGGHLELLTRFHFPKEIIDKIK
jgi:hypothetical protein